MVNTTEKQKQLDINLKLYHKIVYQYSIMVSQMEPYIQKKAIPFKTLAHEKELFRWRYGKYSDEYLNAWQWVESNQEFYKHTNITRASTGTFQCTFQWVDLPKFKRLFERIIPRKYHWYYTQSKNQPLKQVA